MYTIENECLSIKVAAKGAELQSMLNRANGVEYIWNGDPAFWGKHSPLLFPIVGTLKENTYYYRNKAFNLSRHGFAREKDFTLHKQSADELCFFLKSSIDTIQNYPFDFELQVSYKLDKASLIVCYNVSNTGKDPMYFSIGGHPAFRLPIFSGDSYGNYVIRFSKKETVDKWMVTSDGLIDDVSEPFLKNDNQLILSKSLFYKDAIVLKDLKSDHLKLLSAKTGEGFQFDFCGFPYLGIWAAKDADFVCIEPWCGIADGVNTNQQLQDKEGIISLQPNENFKRNWSFSIV